MSGHQNEGAESLIYKASKLQPATLRHACTWVAGALLCSTALVGSVEWYAPGSVANGISLAAHLPQRSTPESRLATEQFTQALHLTFVKPSTAMSVAKQHPTGGDLTAHLARINRPVLEPMIKEKRAASRVAVKYSRILKRTQKHMVMRFTVTVWFPPEPDETGESISGSFSEDYTVKFSLQEKHLRVLDVELDDGARHAKPDPVHETPGQGPGEPKRKASTERPTQTSRLETPSAP